MDSITLYITASVSVVLSAFVFLMYRRVKPKSSVKMESHNTSASKPMMSPDTKNEAHDKPAKSTVNCPHCNAAIARYSLFCGVCGKPTVKQTAPSSSADTEPRITLFDSFNSSQSSTKTTATYNVPIQPTAKNVPTEKVARKPKPAPRAVTNELDPDDYCFDIVGESNYQVALAAIAGQKQSVGKQYFCTAVIAREPNNPYDKYACVVTIDNKKVGYISKADNRNLISAFSEKGFPITVPAMIVGGWSNAATAGSYGVKLKPLITTAEFSQHPATAEQKKMFKYVEGTLPRNLSADQFKKHLSTWKKELPDTYIQWESLEEIIDQLSDSDIRYEYGIKKVSKKEITEAFEALLSKGVNPEDISEDIDIIVEYLLKNNSSLSVS